MPISKLCKVTVQSRNCTRAYQSSLIHVASAAPHYFFAKLSTCTAASWKAMRGPKIRTLYILIAQSMSQVIHTSTELHALELSLDLILGTESCLLYIRFSMGYRIYVIKNCWDQRPTWIASSTGLLADWHLSGVVQVHTYMCMCMYMYVMLF